MKPWIVPGYSMDEIDRVRVRVGPSPRNRRATHVKLRELNPPDRSPRSDPSEEKP